MEVKIVRQIGEPALKFTFGLDDSCIIHFVCSSLLWIGLACPQDCFLRLCHDDEKPCMRVYSGHRTCRRTIALLNTIFVNETIFYLTRELLVSIFVAERPRE